MSDLYTFINTPTGEESTVASGRITQSGEIFVIELKDGIVRLFVYAPDENPQSLLSIAHAPDDAHLIIEFNGGCGDWGNRCGGALITALLTEWIAAYLDGSLLATDLQSMRNQTRANIVAACLDEIGSHTEAEDCRRQANQPEQVIKWIDVKSRLSASEQNDVDRRIDRQVQQWMRELPFHLIFRAIMKPLYIAAGLI